MTDQRPCLIKSLIASLKGWINPLKATLFGPSRFWESPRIFRSINVTKATFTSTGIINNKTFTFFKECKDNGDLYGTVKPKEITNLIKESSKAEINPSQIILKEEINKIGIFKAEINFHSEVKANISLKIDKIQSR